MLAKSSVGISLSCRSYHAIFTLHQNIFNGVLVCLSFRYSTCRYKTLYVWLQLPISSFWAYSIRISTSILNEKVYSAHSTLLLHTFPYHLHLTSFTWFLAVYYFILTSFTSPSATTASSSYTLVILLFSIRLLTHFTRFHSVYLNRYSLNSLRLLVESLWNRIQENERD